MNVLEKIEKTLSECQRLGLSASQATSLSIYDSKILQKNGCTMLLNVGTGIPEIIKNTFNREVYGNLHYYTHSDFITTFVFHNS